MPSLKIVIASTIMLRSPHAAARALSSSAPSSSRAPLQVLDSLAGFRLARKQLPPSATLGLVPTMGVSLQLIFCFFPIKKTDGYGSGAVRGCTKATCRS